MLHVFTYISEDKYINYYMEIENENENEFKFYESSTYKSFSIDDMILLYGNDNNNENGNFYLVLEKLEEYKDTKNKELLNEFEPIIMFNN